MTAKKKKEIQSMGKYRCLPTQVGLSDKIWGGWLDWWWWLYKQHWLNNLWPKHSSKGFISLGHVWLFAIPWIAAHQAYVHGLLLAKILEWVFYFLLQGIFWTQGSNLDLQHCRQILYCLIHQGSHFICVTY